jgi:hypothetical protein
VAASPVKGKYDQTADPQSAYEILQKRLVTGDALPPSGTAGAPAARGQAPSQVPSREGVLKRMGDVFRNVFGIDRPRGTALTTSQQVARNVARAVAAGVATQVAATLAKSTGSKTAGTISKAVVRGALGGVLKR